jgi:hypothetical protein
MLSEIPQGNRELSDSAYEIGIGLARESNDAKFADTADRASRSVILPNTGLCIRDRNYLIVCSRYHSSFNVSTLG